jgi:hypothetical protein
VVTCAGMIYFFVDLKKSKSTFLKMSAMSEMPSKRKKTYTNTSVPTGLKLENGFLNFVDICHLAVDILNSNCECLKLGWCPGCELHGHKRSALYLCCQSLHFCFLCRPVILTFQNLEECIGLKDLVKLIVEYVFTSSTYTRNYNAHYFGGKPWSGELE